MKILQTKLFNSELEFLIAVVQLTLLGAVKHVIQFSIFISIATNNFVP